MQKEKKKPGFFGTLLRIVLIFLLLLILLLSGLFLYLKTGMSKADITLDDIPACVAAGPMDPSERFSFSTDGRMSFALDKNDIWWLLHTLYGDAWQAEATAEAERLGLDFRGVGICLTERGAYADGEAFWKNIRLAVSVPFEISCENGAVVVRPAGVEIAGIRLSLELLRRFVPMDPKGLSFAYAPRIFFMAAPDSVSFREGRLLLNGDMSADLLENLPSFSGLKAKRFSFLMEGFGDVLLATEAYAEGNPPYAELLPRWMERPETFSDFAYAVFTLMEAEPYARLMPESQNGGFMRRWLPQMERISDDRASVEERYLSSSEKLNAFLDVLEDAYASGKITVQEGKYIFQGEELTPQALCAGAWEEYRALFGGEDFIFCAMNHPGYADNDAREIRELSDGPESFSGEIDLTRKRPLPLLVHGKDGRPYLIFRSTSNVASGGRIVVTTQYNVVPLSWEEYEALSEAEKIPVYQ